MCMYMFALLCEAEVIARSKVLQERQNSAMGVLQPASDVSHTSVAANQDLA